MNDPTEKYRHDLQPVVNAVKGSREYLEGVYPQVWDPKQVAEDFEILDFRAPFMVAKRKADGQIGSLMFQHYPRFYFEWVADAEQISVAMGEEEET
jgi:hypothetical protein